MERRFIRVFCVFFIMVPILTCLFGYKSIGVQLISYIDKADELSTVEKINSFFSAVELGFSDGLFLKDKYINLYGGVQHILGKSIIVGKNDGETIIKADTGALFLGDDTSSITFEVSQKDIEKVLDETLEIKSYCDSHKANFLYVIAPSKDSYLNEIQFPYVAGLKDRSISANKLEKALSANSIDVLNLSALLHSTSEDYHSQFFQTDHHWKIETAFWGYQELCKKLNAAFEWNIEKKYYSEENYSTEILESCFLGSTGTRVGKYYATEEDYALISPKFETNLDIVYFDTLGKQVKKKGDFKKTVFGKLSTPIAYGSYISSDRDTIFVDNLLNDDGKKVLLIKNSFAIPISAWLTSITDKLWIVDLRYPQDKTVSEMISDYGIDTVLVVQ